MAAVAKHTLLEDGSHEATDFDSAEASMSQVSRGWSKIKKVALVLAVASLAVSAILISQHFKVKPAFDTDAPVIVEDPAVVEELWDNCAICANCNGQKCNVAAHGGGCWCVCGHKHLGTSECSSTPSGPYNAQGPSWGIMLAVDMPDRHAWTIQELIAILTPQVPNAFANMGTCGFSHRSVGDQPFSRSCGRASKFPPSLHT